MNIQEISKKMILHLRLSKLDNTGIFPPIMLCELLNHKGFTKYKLKQGFISLANEGHCWHLWIENDDDGDIIDINHDIACHLNEYFRNLHFDLTSDIPEKFDKDETNVQLWELYNEDKKKFWKEQPMKIKNFRAKIFNKIFKN